MKNLIIFGTGDFAVECYHWLQDMIEDSLDSNFKGFVSTNNDFPIDSNLNKYYLGSEKSYIIENNDYFVLAIAGNLEVKKKIVSILDSKSCKFFNIIHPSTIIKTKSIGIGNIFSPNTIISYDVNIGNHNSFNCNVSVGHHAQIENFNTINSHCDITGHCKIGSLNFFGSSVIMLPKSKIGNRNRIAAGSVVYKKFRDDSTISGNPAMKYI